MIRPPQGRRAASRCPGEEQAEGEGDETIVIVLEADPGIALQVADLHDTCEDGPWSGSSPCGPPEPALDVVGVLVLVDVRMMPPVVGGPLEGRGSKDAARRSVKDLQDRMRFIVACAKSGDSRR